MTPTPPPSAASSDREIAEVLCDEHIAPGAMSVGERDTFCADIEAAIAAKGIATERETVERCWNKAMASALAGANEYAKYDSAYNFGFQKGAEDAAAAIRALSPPDPEPTHELDHGR